LEVVVSQEAGKRRIAQLIQTYGCLPDAPDGPRLERFDAEALATAIDQEIARSIEYGWSKLTIHMDIPDARLLASYLRRA
jgi:hypothetical protein